MSDVKLEDAKLAVEQITEDMEMLDDGSWIPDSDSISATVDNLERIGKYLAQQDKPEPLHIVFGEIPHSYKVFEFNTNAELTAFLEGLDAMDGYLTYTPAEQTDADMLELLKQENEPDYNALVEYLGKEVA